MSLPIRRPVAVAMFFLGIVLMGAVAWQRMPVELFPALAGDRLFVSFTRPGSESQVVEREIAGLAQQPEGAILESAEHAAVGWSCSRMPRAAGARGAGPGPGSS